MSVQFLRREEEVYLSVLSLEQGGALIGAVESLQDTEEWMDLIGNVLFRHVEITAQQDSAIWSSCLKI